MKRLLVALIASGFCMSVTGQNVSVNAKNAEAERVFESIMKQTGKNFVYSSDLLKNVKVSVYAKDESLSRVLEKMFANTSISYKIKGNSVILSRILKENKITISGYIRESETGEALIGAIVRDKKNGRSAVTNAAGFYSMRIEPGQADISVSFPTFETVVVNKDIMKSEKLDFFMKESTSEDGQTLKEVTIIADRNKSLAMESTDIGRLNLSRNDIQSTPTLFGESDVVKTLQLQPGVSAGTEGLAGMYVHGGGNDENL
ncbi:MAG: secretin and TonB N-terminal domain-containing protein, partial [Muribaculaceae bacterium]|nr:secretin and TonB N-terminal domain-containing protein [Muribaculaceae bacterium]